MSFKFSRLFLIGIVLIIFGGVSYVAEMTFYNSIDDNNVLQESFFLPLTFILGFMGAIVMILSVVINLIKKIKRKRIK